jgi:SAM-dependent methyltransferase
LGKESAVPEYIDYAQFYDHDHQGTVPDLEFYLDYARQCGSPVLELACGTGRLLVPMAEAGFAMSGVDLSKNMLAVCKKKVEDRKLAGRVSLVHASMTDYDLSRRDFALAFIAFRSFMHLYSQDEQLACLACTYEHLRPGGLLLIDIYAPLYALLAQDPNQPFAVRREFDLPNGHHVIRKDRFVKNDSMHQIQYAELRFEEYDLDGVMVNAHTIPLSTRYTFHFEMQLLLEKAGFEVIDLFRDFDKTPFDGTGEIITVARRAA